MPATARLMVLMSPEERAALDGKARSLGVSAGEVVRRAVLAYDASAEKDAAELSALIDAFSQIHPETLRIADETHRRVAKLFGERGSAQARSHAARRAAGR